MFGKMHSWYVRCFQVQTEYKLITSTRTKKREENYAYKKNKKMESVSDLDASNYVTNMTLEVIIQ